MHAVFPSKEERDRVIREYGAEEGGHQTVGRLAAYLGALSAVGAEKPVFTITRIFDAPRAVVWKVHSDVAYLSKWWGPKGFTWLKGTLDFKPGGTFHYGMRGPTGQEMWGKFNYRQIVPQEKIIFINSFSDAAGNTTRAPFAEDWPLEVLNTVIFTERNGKTMLAMSGTPINATKAELARFEAMKPSMNQGFSGTFEQLDAYLAEMRG
ncbi:MAG: SRPBCC domain-containing protein [Proteobacteria bacterium]|nr:SRPBCC domain-containing protein [Pseudomonadota bacterium]